MQCPLSSSLYLHGWSSEVRTFYPGKSNSFNSRGLILTLTEHTIVVIYLRITCQPKKWAHFLNLSYLSDHNNLDCTQHYWEGLTSNSLENGCVQNNSNYSVWSTNISKHRDWKTFQQQIWPKAFSVKLSTVQVII